MNINVLVMTLLASIIGFYTWKAFLHQNDPLPSQLPWTTIDVSKSRSFVNQTRDAGMFIERTRRAAIINNPKPVFSYKGSTNGSLEYFFISGVLTDPRPVCPAEPAPVIWSSGDADDEICDIVDAGGAFGGYDVIDSGGAIGNVCDE